MFPKIHYILKVLFYLWRWLETWHLCDPAMPPFSVNHLQVWQPSWHLLGEVVDCVMLWWHRTQLLPQETQAVSQEQGYHPIWRWRANLAFNFKRKFAVTDSHGIQVTGAFKTDYSQWLTRNNILFTITLLKAFTAEITLMMNNKTNLMIKKIMCCFKFFGPCLFHIIYMHVQKKSKAAWQK